MYSSDTQTGGSLFHFYHFCRADFSHSNDFERCNIRTMTSLTSLYATAAEKPKYHLPLKSAGDCSSARFNLPW